MATSGRVEGSTHNFSKFYFQWQLSSQDIDDNRSRINWQWGLETSSGAYWGSNAVKSVSGYINGSKVFGGNTWSNVSGNGDHQLLSGSMWINHGSDGSKSFGISSTGNLYTFGNVSGGSGSWSLPTIPRNSQVSTNKSSYTLGEAITVNTNRKSSSFTHRIRFRRTNSGGTIIKQYDGVGSSVTWTPSAGEIATMQSWIPTSNSLTLYIESWNNQVDQASAVTRTLTLTNANPIFTDFAYKDTNPTSVGVTGNDQVIIQGKSTLSAVVSAANKMVAVKSATPVKYTFSFDTLNAQTNYSVSDITQAIGTPVTAGIKSLTARAFDSRNNSSQITKSIDVIPYTPPVITATVERENGFEDQTALNISGTYSLVSVSGTPKNTVSLVRYRYRIKDGTWGAWLTKSFTLDAANIVTTETLLSLDNNEDFEFEVEVTDKFGTVVFPMTLNKGNPILWIGSNRTVAINHKPEEETEGLYVLPDDQIWDQIYPVYRSYVTTSSAENPNSLYRGTWTRTGSGPYTWTRTA